MRVVDPVVDIFGKEVADIIYRLLWQMQMKLVNNQYHSYLIISPEEVYPNDGRVRLNDSSRRSYFTFNYRDTIHLTYIHHWNKFQKPYKPITAILPKSYWNIKELY